MSFKRLLQLLRKAEKRIGRRGAYLFVTSILFMGYGKSINIVSSLPAERRSLYRALEVIFPLAVWSYVWLIVGLLCLLGMFFKKIDRLSYVAIVFLSMLWGVGAGMADFITPSTGLARNSWVAGVIFTSLGVTQLIVSGWPEIRSSPLLEEEDLHEY